MISCAICNRPLQECCDIYFDALDRWTGADVVICGSCVDEHNIPFEDEVEEKDGV